MDPFRFTRETAKAYREHKGLNADLVNGLVADRAAARLRKDFKESDRIRDQLGAMGVVLKDGKDAEGKPMTSWDIVR